MLFAVGGLLRLALTSCASEIPLPFVSAPNAEVRTEGPYIGDGRDGWHVYLRCPGPRVIPSGGEIEILFDTCSPTTYEPGPKAQLRGFRLTAREGYYETAIEGGPRVLRKR